MTQMLLDTMKLMGWYPMSFTCGRAGGRNFIFSSDSERETATTVGCCITFNYLNASNG